MPPKTKTPPKAATVIPRARRMAPLTAREVMAACGPADDLTGWLRVAEIRGKRIHEPSDLEIAATRVVSAIRLALEARDVRGIRAADNWAREYLDEHERGGDRRLTWAEAGRALVAHAARVLKVPPRWSVDDSLREGALVLTRGVRDPSRAQYIAAAMILRAKDARGGLKYVVGRIDLRAAARWLADEIVSAGLATMKPRTLARLAVRAVGASSADVERLFAAEKKRAQRRGRS